MMSQKGDELQSDQESEPSDVAESDEGVEMVNAESRRTSVSNGPSNAEAKQSPLDTSSTTPSANPATEQSEAKGPSTRDVIVVATL
jgi:hypothetical protein